MKVSIILADVHVSVTKDFLSIPVTEPLVGMYVLCMLVTDFSNSKCVDASGVLPTAHGTICGEIRGSEDGIMISFF